MTENNEKNGGRTPFILRVDTESESVRNIGTLVRRNSVMELIKRIIAEAYESCDRAAMPIIFDSPYEPFCVHGAPSGKSSFFSAHFLASRCNKVERPRAVCFAGYMTRLKSPYIPEEEYRAMRDNGNGLSFKGCVPSSLYDSHPELYK